MPILTDKAVGELLERYKTAVFAKDTDAFMALYEPDARIFDMWVEWSYDGADSWRVMVTEWFSSLNADRDVVEFHDVRTTVSGDMAAVTAFVQFTAVSAGGKKLRSMHERLTWILSKKDRAWRIAHQHKSGPIDFKTMKVILQRPQP
jgi:uncharacterized protein (TIGR02246 family)